MIDKSIRYMQEGGRVNPFDDQISALEKGDIFKTSCEGRTKGFGIGVVGLTKGPEGAVIGAAGVGGFKIFVN